jgi:hypothetical protein
LLLPNGGFGKEKKNEQGEAWQKNPLRERGSRRSDVHGGWTSVVTLRRRDGMIGLPITLTPVFLQSYTLPPWQKLTPTAEFGIFATSNRANLLLINNMLY